MAKADTHIRTFSNPWAEVAVAFPVRLATAFGTAAGAIVHAYSNYRERREKRIEPDYRMDAKGSFSGSWWGDFTRKQHRNQNHDNDDHFDISQQ